MPRIKRIRKKEESDHKACLKCPAICCKSLAMTIHRPKNKKDLADLKWQLQFDSVRIYIRDRKWYLLVDGKCSYLGADDKCTCYETRPKICRMHNPPHCEFFGRYYDLMLTTPEELEGYYYPKYYDPGKKGK